MRTKKELKAQNLLKLGKVLFITETLLRQFFITKGSKNNIYSVIYNNDIGAYTCNCKNIKFTDCYHILAVKLLKDKEGL